MARGACSPAFARQWPVSTRRSGGPPSSCSGRASTSTTCGVWRRISAGTRPRPRAHRRLTSIGRTASTTSFAIAPKQSGTPAAGEGHTEHHLPRIRSCHSASSTSPIAVRTIPSASGSLNPNRPEPPAKGPEIEADQESPGSRKSPAWVALGAEPVVQSRALRGVWTNAGTSTNAEKSANRRRTRSRSRARPTRPREQRACRRADRYTRSSSGIHTASATAAKTSRPTRAGGAPAPVLAPRSRPAGTRRASDESSSAPGQIERASAS